MVLLNICVSLLCISFQWSSLVFFVAKRHWRNNTRDDSKGRILADLIDRPKNFWFTFVANNFIINGVVILFSFIGKNLFAAISSPALKFTVEVIVVTFYFCCFEVLPKVYASETILSLKNDCVPISILDKLLVAY
jgi:hypothetical protein